MDVGCASSPQGEERLLTQQHRQRLDHRPLHQNHYMQRLDAWSTKQTDLAVRHQIRRALEDQKLTDVLGFLISTTGHASAHVRAAG